MYWAKGDYVVSSTDLFGSSYKNLTKILIFKNRLQKQKVAGLIGMSIMTIRSQ